MTIYNTKSSRFRSYECSQRSLVKPHTEFFKNTSRVSKRNSSCKDCQKESRTARMPNPPVEYSIECSSCLVTKEADYFHKNKGNKTGRNSTCRRCVSKSAPTYTQDTKKQERLARNKVVIDKYKTICGGCSTCGFKENPVALEFVHLSSSAKYTIRASWGAVRLEKELSQCRVLCSNCYLIESHTNNIT